MQLRIEEAARCHSVVAARPFTVSGHRSPAGIGAAAVVLVGRIAVDGGCGALPEHTVGSVPSGSHLPVLHVAERQVVALDVHHVEEESGGPGAYAAAETERALAVALHKSIRTGGTVVCGEVMVSVFRNAALEEVLLSTRQEHPAAPSSRFRHGFGCHAVLHRHAAGLLLQVHGAPGEMSEIHAAHPAVCCAIHAYAVPAVVFILRVPVVAG